GEGDETASVVSARSFADIFSVRTDGGVDEAAPSRIDPTRTNGQLAAGSYIYLTGDLPADVGLRLGPGRTPDPSGAAIIDPNATALLGPGRQAVTGRVVAGGTLQTATPVLDFSAAPLFAASPFETGPFSNVNPRSVRPALALVATPGASVDLSGA